MAPAPVIIPLRATGVGGMPKAGLRVTLLRTHGASKRLLQRVACMIATERGAAMSLGETWMLRGLAVAATAAVAGLAQGASVALVTDVVGDAVQGGEPVRLLGELAAGTEVAVGERSRVVVFYFADGSEWTLAGPGRYKLAARAPTAPPGAAPLEKRAAPAGLRDVKLRTDRIAQGGVVMRSASRPALTMPVDEVVLDADVRFAWEGFGPGARYQFELVDQAGTRLFGLDTTDSELRLPPAVRLQPGSSYYWSVRGRDAIGSHSFYRVAEFRVADAATTQRVNAALPKSDAPFSERVLYVALLEGVGARSAASAARQALAAERPAPWAPARGR